MLPKSQRLNLKKEFNFVINGRKRETESLKLFYRLGENTQALVGIALTKKLFPKSHDRNKIKRVISQSVQLLYPDLIHNLNLVIMPKIGSKEKTSEDILKELNGIKDLYYPN